MTDGPKGMIMKRTCIFVCVIVLGMAAAVKAHNTVPVGLTCPICSTEFVVGSLGTYSTSGGSAEGRPRSYFNVVEATVFYCPCCHYAGQQTVFKIHDNDYYTLDLPNAEQAKAIRAMLAKRKDLRPGKLLYPIERFELVEKCLRLRNAKPRAILNASLMCAWICDDAAEDALALKYRKQAIEDCKETLKDKTLTDTQRIWRRKLYWVLTSNIGKSNEALRGLTDLLADSKRTVQAAKKQLPQKPKGYDEADGDMPYELQDHDKDEEVNLFDPDADAPDPDPPMDPKIKARLQKIWRSWLDFDKLTRAAEAVEDEIIWIRYKTLDPVAAIQVARSGDYLHRYAFVEVYRSREDPKIIAAIKAFIAKPLGQRPNSTKRHEFKERQRRCRERLLNVIMEGAGTSPQLRTYAFNKGKSEGFFRFTDPGNDFLVSPGGLFDDEEDYDPFKNVKTAELADRLSRAWKKINREVEPGYWEIPRDVLSELTRRSDKLAIATTIADFEQHLDWYTATAEDLTRDPDQERDIESMCNFKTGIPYRTIKRFWPFYRKIARSPELTTAAARRLIEKIGKGKLRGDAAVTGIMPLGFLKTKESRQLLLKAAGSKNPEAAFAAAKCLLIRKDPAAKDTLINVILTHLQWDVPGDETGDTFRKMLDSKDAAVLSKLKKVCFENPDRHKQSLSTETMYYRGSGTPIRLAAMLAELDSKQMDIYETLIADLGRPEKRPKDRNWSQPAGGYKVGALIDASEICYRPSIGKQLAAAMEHLSDGETTPKLIETLMKLSADDCTRALAKQLRRPITLSVKLAIIKASKKLNIPGLPKKLIEWSKSSNPWLAKPAKAAIARMEKTRK